jgi:hypothetical protein
VKHRLLTIAAVASMLLCLATVVFWVRSYWRFDAAYYIFDTPPSIALHSLRGAIEASLVSTSSQDKTLAPGLTLESDPGASFSLATEGRTLWGFYLGQNGQRRRVSVPYWFVVFLFAILPSVRACAAGRSRRFRRAGRCLACGYDLRATTDRCPECGAAPAATAAR